MNLVEITLIAVGLAMDCFAISVACGIGSPAMAQKLAARIAVFFGGFQFLMTVIGWSAGYALRQVIEGVDHWIAFGLLAAVGAKMIYESTRGEEGRNLDPSRFSVLIALSVATSIDALAVGVSLSLIDVPILMPACVIGAVSFMAGMIGVALGKRFGHIFERKLEAVGGLILVGIGVKILIEHLTQG